jgi:hypothetical protein
MLSIQINSLKIKAVFMASIFRHPVLSLLMLSLFISCKKGSNGQAPDPGPPAQETFIVKSKKEIFGFYGESRYSYCPSLVKEQNGNVHLFFCGTQNMIMVDNIYHLRINPDGTQSAASIVLTPGAPGSWDDHHTCDPSLIKGDFKMNGVHYQYALFYLTNAYGVYYNEIGVAFSNDLEGNSWVKYAHPLVQKTWAGAGDQTIGSQKAWGVGQPSAVSLNKAGQVLLTYTIGDVDGTRVVWARIDLSDVDNYSPVTPTTMVRTGLSNITYNGTDVTTNADFALDNVHGKIVIVRPVHPNLDQSYPTHVENAVEVAYMSQDDFFNSRGSWTAITRITPAVSGFPRNHNPGIERNAFGEIDDWKAPVIYYTVSKAEPDVRPSGTNFAEWTYHIWRAEIGVKE